MTIEPGSKEEFETIRKAARLYEQAANDWMDRALKAEAELEAIKSVAKAPAQ